MKKYYTRACNFYFGKTSFKKLKKKLSLPLGGNRDISFDTVEIITRSHSKYINIKDIKLLSPDLKKKVLGDLKNICKLRKIKSLNFKSLPILMGVINLTPDSFSDGGYYNTNKLAKLQIDKLIKSGANIIDIGGESTRPGSNDVDQNEEWARIQNSIKYLNSKKIFVSLDSRKTYVMQKAYLFKLNLINDVSGLSYDKNIFNFLKKSKLPFVLHHMKGSPKTMQKKPTYKNVLLDIYDFFEDKLKKLRKKGISHNQILIDPGIGFGKNLKHNITLIRHISIFHSLGLPILLGVSRKRFINEISGIYDSKNRLGGTLSSSIYSFTQGVQVLRIHDVNEINQGLKVFKKIIFDV